MRTRIDAILKEQGRSQVWLAKHLGITPQHLTLIINGKIKLTTIRAYKIMELLSIKFEELYEEVK
jgi:DNA-binding XRE family transcriptional regulator